MLVLSRRAGESINIGDDVIVTVLEVRGEVVRVGIAAPRDIQVHREEVYRELQNANRSAASPQQSAVDALAASLGLALPAASGESPPARNEGPRPVPKPEPAAKPAAVPKPGPRPLRRDAG